MNETLPRTRFLRVVAQDPSVLDPYAPKDSKRKILTTKVEVPAEDFADGPRGYRVHVIDYDASTCTQYIPLEYPPRVGGTYTDPFEHITDEEILNDPRFHAQNVYAIVMRTLARFEFALGRRINWGFAGHQINVAPHAFADANAFYSEDDRALLFGYFAVPTTPTAGSKNKAPKQIFTCLCHDIVVHETTHAILDGLRERYTIPSSPEQAGFHEGFADVVALLSVFSLRDVVGILLEKHTKNLNPDPQELNNPDLIKSSRLTEKNLRESVLLGLADEMGEAVSGIRGKALRRSVELPYLKEGEKYLGTPEFDEPHKCGELFVAAIMNAFLQVWLKRIARVKGDSLDDRYLDRTMVVEQASDAAENLLTMVIRAIDYTPPTDIKFADFLSALLTADREAVPDDSRYNYRSILRETFQSYGVNPASLGEKGYWLDPKGSFKYDRTHFDSLLSDPNEVFRFIWDNRNAFQSENGSLLIDDNAYTRVQSVRPCLRVGPDGFVLRETVAEYVQIVTMLAVELPSQNIGKPAGMSDDKEVTLYGGGTLIFDEYGRLKYHINNRVFNQSRQQERIRYLWRYGYFSDPQYTKNAFAKMHLRRSAVFSNHFVEEAFD